MRSRIAWLVGATTSAVILAFVIPLCLLVRSAAEERALAAGEAEARNVASLVSGLHDTPARLPELIASLDARSPAETGVLGPRRVVLAGTDRDLADDPDVAQARKRLEATTVRGDGAAKIVVPVLTDDGTYVVRTTIAESLLRQGVARAWTIMAALGLALLLVSVLIADRIARRISTPVSELARVAYRMSEGELDARAVPAGPPETVELGDTLNQLAERVTELLIAERGQVGDLSHRLRTPVTALRLDAESVKDDEVAARLQVHIAALQRTIDAILRDARRPLRHSMRSSCDASEVVRERMAFWGALAEDQGRPLEVDLSTSSLHVSADAGDLTEVLDILVDNVFAHTAETVPFSVRLAQHDRRVVLMVVDSGDGPGGDAGEDTGMDSGVDTTVDTAEEPSERPGTTGLGLQIARRTVAAIGGELHVESSPGSGFAVTVSLPLDQPPVPA